VTLPEVAAEPAAPRAGATVRLFLALWPSPGVRDGLLAWRDAWRWPAGAAPVPPDKLHLTLHFIGAVPRSRLPELRAGLNVGCEAFELGFGRPELWPGGLAVLRPVRLPDALPQLQQRLGGALQALSIPVESRPFRAHVTMARRAHGAALPREGPALRWRVAGYALVESRPGAGNGYTVLQRYR